MDKVLILEVVVLIVLISFVIFGGYFLIDEGQDDFFSINSSNKFGDIDYSIFKLNNSSEIYFDYPNVTFELEVYGEDLTDNIDVPYVIKVQNYPCEIKSYEPIKVVCGERAVLIEQGGKGK